MAVFQTHNYTMQEVCTETCRKHSQFEMIVVFVTAPLRCDVWLFFGSTLGQVSTQTFWGLRVYLYFIFHYVVNFCFKGLVLLVASGQWFNDRMSSYRTLNGKWRHFGEVRHLLLRISKWVRSKFELAIFYIYVASLLH